MKPMTSIQEAHYSNRKAWFEFFNVDCYLDGFCDVSDDSPSVITEMSNTLISLFAEQIAINSGAIYHYMTVVSVEYLKQVASKLPNTTPEEKIVFRKHVIAVTHLRMCGLFWREYGFNFYHPILLPIDSKEEIDIPEFQRRGTELRRTLDKWKDDQLAVLLSRIERNLHSMA